MALSKAAPVCGHWRVMETDISSRAYLRMRRNDRGSTSPRRAIHKCRRRPPAAVFSCPVVCFFLAQFLHCVRTEAPQIKPHLQLSQRGWRMKWLLAWLIVNALFIAWRALMVSKRMGTRDRLGRTGGAQQSVLLYRTSASATAMSAGIVRRCQPSQPLAPLSSPLASAEAASAVFAIS